MRPIAFVGAIALLAAVGSASAQEYLPSRALPHGHGVYLRSGSSVTTTLDDELDVDDYTFDGYPGAKVRASLRWPHRDRVNLHLELIRPDGTIVAAHEERVRFRQGERIMESRRFQVEGTDPPEFQDDPIGPLVLTTRIRYVLDQVGVWKLRVRTPDLRIEDADTAKYTLSVRIGKPPRVRAIVEQPDQNDQHVFLVPARGGASLRFRLATGRDHASLNSITTLGGEPVEWTGVVKYRFRDGVSARGLVLEDEAPLGLYRVTFDVQPRRRWIRFTARVRPPKVGLRLRGRLDGREPALLGPLEPNVGGTGTEVSVVVLNALDEQDPESPPTLLLGGREVVEFAVTPTVQPGTLELSGEVPPGMSHGVHDVVVRTSGGHVAVAESAFTHVPAPLVTGVDPDVGSTFGGAEITLTGGAFRPGHMAIVIDGAPSPAVVLEQTTTTVRFVAPPYAAAFVHFGVRDTETGLVSTVTAPEFAYVNTPEIVRVSPGLVPVLGGETVTLVGFHFRDDDHVFLETSTEGVFEDLSATQQTYRNRGLHEFVAPVRPKGRYGMYVEDALGFTSTRIRTIDVFEFGDFTAQLGAPAAAATGWTTALADFDKDGDTDLFVAQRGSGPRQATSQITLFENAGDGELSDATSRISAPSANDDWRADRIRVVDVTSDDYPDIVITTADTNVPAASESHTRILVSEQRSASSAVDDRVFRDRTLDLMAPPRRLTAGNGPAEEDNWRALDMWVGDIESGPPGPPEILITGEDVFEDLDVLCGNYCSSNIGGALYRFYWGGSRAFVWDPELRAGQGRFRFDHNFFPRRSGVLVPIGGAPEGVIIPACNSSTPCRGTFTPFTGHTLVVRDLNADGRKDVVVVSNDPIIVRGSLTASTQVALFGFSVRTGARVTDLTGALADLGGDTRGDTAAIAILDSPYVTIIIAKRAAPAGGAPALRLLRFVPPLDEDDSGSFEDVTDSMLPATSGGESWQATAIGTIDVDEDGDEDLVLLSDSVPVSGESALRILRNVATDPQTHDLLDAYRELLPPLQPGGDPFDGALLAIGDLDGDGAREYVVTRAAASGSGAQTRVLTTDR